MKIPKSYQLVISVFTLLLALMLYASVSNAEVLYSDLIETRYTDKVERYANGRIKRSGRVKQSFQLQHPCPSTGKKVGACPNWQKDHVIPLACGGRDAVSNMQWLRIDTKAQKDRYERKIYALTPPTADTARCRNKVMEVKDD